MALLGSGPQGDGVLVYPCPLKHVMALVFSFHVFNEYWQVFLECPLGW